MTLICEMRFGSHLYGTATETSDIDIKGVFVPDVTDILLGRIPKVKSVGIKDDTRKNEPQELDCEYYSLHHFIKLAAQGQTVAIDMLFSPTKSVKRSDEYGWIWDRIVKNRHKFLSKEMNAFVGYARGQAAKYSLKGSRLKKLEKFAEILRSVPLTSDYIEIGLVWEQLPKDDERQNPQGIRELQIAGKWFGETTSIPNVLQSVDLSLAKYGKRARSASEADGVDWKALSHAVRVSKELIELLTFGEVNFPLIDAPLLLEIKQGKRSLEEVQTILDRDLAFIELHANESNLPDKVDHQWVDRFLLDIMSDYLSKELVRVMEADEEER